MTNSPAVDDPSVRNAAPGVNITGRTHAGKVIHLDAATMCPHSARLVNGCGGWLDRARLVCHVLLVETADGLTLVDTGLGTADLADPARMGRRWVSLVSPRLNVENTAVMQLRRMGYRPSDVHDIVLTHLDVDHAGGLPDFPAAAVHVHQREYAAAMADAAAYGRPGRYRAVHWQHGPRWSLTNDGGDRWYGFEGVRSISSRHSNVLMVPLPGHTPGHCGVAVRESDKWLLHAGDGYFSHRQIESPPRRPPAGLGWFQRRADTDRAARRANQDRLRELAGSHGDEVIVFCSHDPIEFDRYRTLDAMLTRPSVRNSPTHPSEAAAAGS